MASDRPADLAAALLDPTAVFAAPEDVLARDDIADADKVEILRRWEYDARELAVATEENMPDAGDAATLLARIHAALRALGAPIDPERDAPTKHGGS